MQNIWGTNIKVLKDVQTKDGRSKTGLLFLFFFFLNLIWKTSIWFEKSKHQHRKWVKIANWMQFVKIKNKTSCNITTKQYSTALELLCHSSMKVDPELWLIWKDCSKSNWTWHLATCSLCPCSELEGGTGWSQGPFQPQPSCDSEIMFKAAFPIVFE